MNMEKKGFANQPHSKFTRVIRLNDLVGENL